MAPATPNAWATTSRASALRAALAGYRARRDGDPAGSCPFDANGDRAARFHAGYWMKGYRMAALVSPA